MQLNMNPKKKFGIFQKWLRIVGQRDLFCIEIKGLNKVRRISKRYKIEIHQPEAVS